MQGMADRGRIPDKFEAVRRGRPSGLFHRENNNSAVGFSSLAFRRKTVTLHQLVLQSTHLWALGRKLHGVSLLKQFAHSGLGLLQGRFSSIPLESHFEKGAKKVFHLNNRVALENVERRSLRLDLTQAPGLSLFL